MLSNGKILILTSDERRLIMWNMGFFQQQNLLTANNLVLAVYRHVTNPECRQYLLRQAYEEAVHTDTFIYCCDSLGTQSLMNYIICILQFLQLKQKIHLLLN